MITKITVESHSENTVTGTIILVTAALARASEKLSQLGWYNSARECNMKDREFLIWIHERLEHVYKENPCMDFMHKLRCIIRATPTNQLTPNINSKNSLEELKNELSN